ncbi:MAG: hypothetical protein GOV02_03840, partial [Candidatus Aenigmarchaeota archaeon]|nr:hypothetical protein [Candidatus Aenigmarchaeota archaeon]
MKYETFKEGKVNVTVPKGAVYERNVFFNPAAELTRDISVAALQVFQKKFDSSLIVCDALSGSGSRGLRYAKEVKKVKSVVLNDKNPISIKIIKKNIKQNKLEKKCVAVKKDANLLMRENVYNVIDIDPFGSPTLFLDSAAKSIYHSGLLMVTATDLMVLSGVCPDACFKKYGVRSMKAEYYSELGARIIISSIIRALAKRDRAFIPLLTFVEKHYVRTIGMIGPASKLTKSIKEFDYVTEGNKTIGPVYLGPIQDKNFCKDVKKEIENRKFRLAKKEIKLMDMIIGEADMPAFYYDIH